jgi:hypothetical protein
MIDGPEGPPAARHLQVKLGSSIFSLSYRLRSPTCPRISKIPSFPYWCSSFRQPRTFRRAVRQALGSLVCLGRRGLSRLIWTNGGQQRSWSAEYFLHSHSPWQPQTLFASVFRRALAYCPDCLVGVAVDDTRLPKTGRSIPQVFYQRDPCRHPFMRTSCWACVSCKLPCCSPYSGSPKRAVALCPFASKRLPLSKALPQGWPGSLEGIQKDDQAL